MKYIVMIGLLITSNAAMAQVTPQMVQDSSAALVVVEDALLAAERLAAPTAGIREERHVDAGWQKMMDSAEEVDDAVVSKDDLAAWGKWEDESPRVHGDEMYYVIDKAAATYTVPEDDIDWLDLKK